MRCYDKKDGMDPSLLFFFLILVMIFCRPGIVGCGNDCCESTCEPADVYKRQVNLCPKVACCALGKKEACHSNPFSAEPRRQPLS